MWIEYLHSCSFEGLSEMGAVHAIVHLVARIDVQLETGAHFTVSWLVYLVLHDFPNVFVLIIVSKLFVQFVVGLWLHRVTAGQTGILIRALEFFASINEIQDLETLKMLLTASFPQGSSCTRRCAVSELREEVHASGQWLIRVFE